MDYKKYLIKKDKLDLLSSLKALDKKLLNEKLEECGVDNIYELKDYILDDFEFCLNESKDDDFTRMYFEKLLDFENTLLMPAQDQDIETFLVFLYNNGVSYSYYIPTEIKQIINKVFGDITFDARMRLADSTPSIRNLRELLETFTVKKLKKIGYLLNVNKLSNINKKDLVKIISNALTDKDKLTSLIKRFIDKELDLLKKLIKNKGTIEVNNLNLEEYYFLYAIGLVFVFRRDYKLYISMTNDIYNVVKEIDLKAIQKIVDENTKVYHLVRSMIELYGVVSNSYLDYYHSLYYGNGKDLEAPNNALLFCDREDNIDVIYKDNNIYFVNEILKEPNLEQILDDIISRQEKIERNLIKLEELLKYSDYNYYEETKAKNKFKKYLKSKNIPSSTIDTIIKIISNMYRLGSSLIENSIDMLQHYGVKITEKNLQEILNYLIEIYNNTRIWENNGWTPIEMRNIV